MYEHLNRITQLENKVNHMQTSIKALQLQYSAIHSVVIALATAATSIDTGIAALNAQIATLETNGTLGDDDIAALTAITSGLSADTSSITSAVTSIQSTLNPTPVGIPIPAPLVINPIIETATIGAAYSATLGVTGGDDPINYSIVGTLPAGLTLSNGVISGTPTAAETATFTIEATDSGNPVTLAQLPVTLVIA